MTFEEMLRLDAAIREAMKPSRDRRTGKVLESLREAAWRVIQRGPANMRPAAFALVEAEAAPWERMRRAAELLP